MKSFFKSSKLFKAIFSFCLLIFLFANDSPAQKKKAAKRPIAVSQPKTVASPANQPKQISKLFRTNLIKNGGAEAGSGAAWTNADELKTFRYDGSWGNAWQVMPPNKGDNYFYAGVSLENPSRTFSQDLDVSEIAKEIDAGQVGYNSGAWFGVRGMAAGRLRIEFYDANKNLIARPGDIADAAEEITLANKPDGVTMVEKTHAGDVSAGTRKITLEFYLFENVSRENEGESSLADNLSLVLTSKGDK